MKKLAQQMKESCDKKDMENCKKASNGTECADEGLF